eukprot:Filipodium_phascolosomae@DN8345_c0_g1_i1.p1
MAGRRASRDSNAQKGATAVSSTTGTNAATRRRGSSSGNKELKKTTKEGADRTDRARTHRGADARQQTSQSGDKPKRNASTPQDKGSSRDRAEATKSSRNSGGSGNNSSSSTGKHSTTGKPSRDSTSAGALSSSMAGTRKSNHRDGDCDNTASRRHVSYSQDHHRQYGGEGSGSSRPTASTRVGACHDEGKHSATETRSGGDARRRSSGGGDSDSSTYHPRHSYYNNSTYASQSDRLAASTSQARTSWTKVHV